jgi:hypothetical protein
MSTTARTRNDLSNRYFAELEDADRCQEEETLPEHTASRAPPVKTSDTSACRLQLEPTIALQRPSQTNKRICL